MLSIPGIIGAFVFAQTNPGDQKLRDIEVDIQNTQLSFITKANVIGMMQRSGLVIGQSALHSIRIHDLEHALCANPWVSKAQVYITAGHALHIRLEQREPVARIAFTDENHSEYYLDQNADPIMLSDQYVAKVPVVTAPELGYTVNDLAIKRQLVELALFIQQDTFWNEMITQIAVNQHHEIQLIPVLGNQVIRLGNTTHLADKMNRLLSFYQKGIATIDWNRYDEIDLRFAKQIVARNTQVAELKDEELEKQIREMKLAEAKSPSPNTNTVQASKPKDLAQPRMKHEGSATMVTTIKH